MHLLSIYCQSFDQSNGPLLNKSVNQKLQIVAWQKIYNNK